MINRTSLCFVDDDDTDHDLYLMLTMAAKFGKLLLDNQEVRVGDKFTQEDINQEKLRCVSLLVSVKYNNIII